MSYKLEDLLGAEKISFKKMFEPPFVLTYYPHDYLIFDGNKKEVCRHFDYKVGYLIVCALNEKWERDFGEPVRWELDDPEADLYLCPKCSEEFISYGNFHNHCPECGQRLLPPEEAQDA